jgi:hypothetical protein
MLFDDEPVGPAGGRGARVKAAGVIGALAIGVLVAFTIVTGTWFRLVLVVTGLCFMAFALAHPRPALFVWLLLAPIGNVYARLALPVGLPDLTFGRVVIGLVAIGIVLRMVLYGRRLASFGALELVMLALVAIMGLDLVMRSGNPASDALQNFDERVTPILLFLAARNLCVRPIDLKTAVGVLAAVGIYLALHGGYQYMVFGSASTTAETIDRTEKEGGMRVNESHLGEGRAVGPFESAVEFGSVAAITMIATLCLALYASDGLWRLLLFALVPLMGAAVAFSSTRSTWLGAYFAIVLMAVLDEEQRKRMLTAIGALSVAALIAAVMLIPETSSLRERASSTEPISGRFLMYKVGLRIAARHPITGYGRGAPSRIAARQELYALGSSDADLAPGQFHDVFLMTLVEWGIGGLAAYIAILVLTVKGALELRRRLERRDFVYHFVAFFLGTAAIFVTQGLLVDTPPFFYLNGVFFFLAGLVYAQLDATAVENPRALEPAYGSTVRLLRTGGSARA